MRFLRLVLAFLRKDLLEDLSYRFALLFKIGAVFLWLFILSVFSDFVGEELDARIERYEGNYFAFAVLGLGLYSFLATAVHELSVKIRRAQVVGTLEALLSTRTSLRSIVVCLPVYPFVARSVYTTVFVAGGALLFDVPLKLGNWPTALLLFLLTMGAFGCIGLLIAGLTIAFKRVEFIAGAVSFASFWMGGVIMTRDPLPGVLQAAAHLLPITPALEGLRLVMLNDAPLGEVLPQVLMLIAFIVVLLPAGILFFRWSVRRAMRDGTLTQY